MKLLNNLFRIVSTQSLDNEYRCEVAFDSEHYLYRAHFPNNPVTPGACLIQMAAEILEIEHNMQLTLTHVVNIKFKEPIGPHDQPHYIFSKTAIEDDILKTSVRILCRDQLSVKMTLIYKIQ